MLNHRANQLVSHVAEQMEMVRCIWPPVKMDDMARYFAEYTAKLSYHHANSEIWKNNYDKLSTLSEDVVRILQEQREKARAI